MIIPFPHNSPLLKAAFEVFQGSREGLIVFTPLVVVSRALLNMATMQGHAQHTKVLTDTILFFIGIYCLESLMMLIMSIPAYAGELVANKDSVSLNKVPSDFHWFSFTLRIADLIDYLTAFIFHLLSILYLLIMSIAIMLGGYVVFFATLFQVRKVFSVFIMICVFLSAWPFIWYSLDRTFEHILSVQNENSSAMGTVVSLLVLALMKLAIPIFGFLGCLQAPVGLVTAAALATKSGAATLSNATRVGARAALAPARAVGANELATMATRPAANRLSNAMKTTTDSVRDLAPFAAYKTSQLLRSTSKSESFSDFQTRNKILSTNVSRIRSNSDASVFTKTKRLDYSTITSNQKNNQSINTERTENQTSRVDSVKAYKHSTITSNSEHIKVSNRTTLNNHRNFNRDVEDI